MNATRDDDALNWAGDDDPTLHDAGADRSAPQPAGLPAGWTTPQATAPAHEPADAAQTTDTVQQDGAAASSVALVGMGILAGMYLLYSIGWFIGVARLSQATVLSTVDPVADFMTSLGGWLAVAAPVIWFGATFWLTMSRPRARWVWLVIGVVVLVPVPFLLGSGVPS